MGVNMKYKKILIATILLLTILSIGAVSASEDADVLAQDSDAVVSQENAVDDDLSDATDENALTVSKIDYLNSTIEYYDGLVDEEYDGPIILVHAPKQNAFTLFISNWDVEHDHPYFTVGNLQEYEQGFYSENDNDEWTYYGITASDLGYFENCSDGETLSLYLADIMREYATTSNPIGEIEFTVFREETGFRLADSNDESDGPIVILEIYGTQYSVIDYDNGPVFSIIISGDEKTGKWKPVDELSDAMLYVHSSDDEIECLKVKLSDLDYTATGSMNNIEHVFYLNDVNNFSGLNEGDFVKFFILRPPVQDAYSERMIYFSKDGIILKNPDDEDNLDDGPEDEDNTIGAIGIPDRVNDGEIACYINLPGKQEGDAWVIADEIASGRIYIASGDDEIVFLNENLTNFDYEVSFGMVAILETGISLADLNNFDGLSDGDTVKFILWKDDGTSDAYEERIIYFEEDGVILVEESENPFHIELRDANVVDNDVVLIIAKDQIPEGVDDEFTIVAELWGNEKETSWKISELEADENDTYLWKTGDLGIDELMWDIDINVDIDIAVIFYEEGEEGPQARDQVSVYKNPAIVSGEIDLDDDYGAIIFNDLLEDKDVNDTFKVIVKKDGEDFATKTFNLSALNEIIEEDEDEDESETRWSITLGELGIDEIGEYGILMQFTPKDGGDLLEYQGEFTVVAFGIRVYPEEGDTYESVFDPVFRVGLDENDTGNIAVFVNGTKVFDKNTSDMIYDEFHRGGDYYIKLNDLGITESGFYNAVINVTARGTSREAEANFFVEVTDNSFEFKDILYLRDNFVEANMGTPVASTLILYINGTKAGEGRVSDGIRWNITDDSLTDEYGFLKPGTYEGKISVGDETVAEGTFRVLDDSGNINVGIKETYATDEPIIINFTGSNPKGYVGDYALFIYVDPVYNEEGGFFDEQYWINHLGVDGGLEDIWDGVHNETLWTLEPGEHTLLIEYLCDEDYPSNESDYLVKFYNFKVSDGESAIETALTADDITTTYGSGESLVATLKDADDNPICGANLTVDFAGIIQTLLTDGKGQISLSTSGLVPKTYVAIIAYDGNGTYQKSNATGKVTVNKAQAKIFLRNALYFVLQTKMVQVTLWDANNKPLAGKTVYINLDEFGLKYSGVTDANGDAYIRVGVGFGVHSATVSFEGDENYTGNSKTGRVRVIKETPSLMLPGKYTKFKATDKVKTVKIYLKDRYDKPLLPGTKVFLRINGQTYVGLIDLNGIATINLNINKAGTYNADLIYLGNTAYNPVRKNTRIFIV